MELNIIKEKLANKNMILKRHNSSLVRILSLSDIEIFGKDTEKTIIDLLKPKIVENINYVISCGDVHNYVFDTIKNLIGVPILAVTGNHHTYLPRDVYNLHFRFYDFDSIRFGGFGGSWRYKPKGKNLYTDNEVEEHLKFFPHVDIFVAHNPMKGVNDVDDSVHNGFNAFRNYCKQKSVPLFLHGHSGLTNIEKLDDTIIIGLDGINLIEFEF